MLDGLTEEEKVYAVFLAWVFCACIIGGVMNAIQDLIIKERGSDSWTLSDCIWVALFSPMTLFIYLIFYTPIAIAAVARWFVVQLTLAVSRQIVKRWKP